MRKIQNAIRITNGRTEMSIPSHEKPAGPFELKSMFWSWRTEVISGTDWSAG